MARLISLNYGHLSCSVSRSARRCVSRFLIRSESDALICHSPGYSPSAIPALLVALFVASLSFSRSVSRS
jgi:hypothetical protein